MQADTDDMQDSPWGALPLEILDRILACLSVPCLFRLRCVCKRWRSLIFHPDFIKTCAEMSPSPYLDPYPAVCYVNDRKNREGFWWAAYDFDQCKWQAMPPLPRRFTSTPWKHQLNGGAGGLLCLWALGEFPTSNILSVCNPITAKWRDLPALIHEWRGTAIRHMFMDEATKSYKIILAGNQKYEVEDEGFQITEVYDSALGSWKKGGRFLPSLYLPSPIGALCKGLLYYLASRPMSYVYDVLIAYNVEGDVWSEIPHILPKRIQGIPYLFECRGCLLMMIHHIGRDSVQSFGFFELNFTTGEWTLLGRMPHENFLAFAYIGSCVASGSRVCITGSTPYKEMVVAVYESSQGTWLWLPTCPLSASEFGKHVEFPFQPSLHAVP